MSLPLPVTLKRFLAPECVLFFGIVFPYSRPCSRHDRVGRLTPGLCVALLRVLLGGLGGRPLVTGGAGLALPARLRPAGGAGPRHVSAGRPRRALHEAARGRRSRPRREAPHTARPTFLRA